MKKIFSILLILQTFGIPANAQSLSDKEIIGTWKVIELKILEIEPIPDEQKEEVNSFINAFSKAKFIFKEKNFFSMNIDIEELQVINEHWKYNSESESFVIQDWKDKDNNNSITIEIYSKRKGDKIFFTFSDVPFVVEVEKE